MNRLERMANRIMRKMKGWRTQDMKSDFEDHPEAHQYELDWLKKELRKVPEILVLDELEEK